MAGVVLVASALAGLATLIMGLWVGDGPFEVPSQSFSWRHVHRVVGNRGVQLSTYGYLGHMWELYAMWTWTAALLTASGAAFEGTYGSVPVLTFAVIAVGGVGAWLAGRWSDRLGRSPVAGAALLVWGMCALGTPLVFGSSPFVGSASVSGVGFGAVLGDVAETAAETVRGTALTLQTALGSC